MSTIRSINPYTEKVNAELTTLTRDLLDHKITTAHHAYWAWKHTPSTERKALFLRLADIIENEKESLAELEMNEMGMLYSFSLAGIGKTATLVRWFANNFEAILSDESYESEWLQVTSQYDPLGVIFGIAPWNFPFNQVLRAAVPNILAWNTVLYKHASNVPLCGEKIEALFLQAWFPEGVYQNIIVSSSESEYILSRPEIAGVNLTGSEGAGKIIGSLAGKYLKPSILELGWNDAFIVADTSDIEKVAQEAVMARVSNAGQKCNSSKRFIVWEQDYEKFCEAFTKRTNSLIIWDPKDPRTELWPLAKLDLLDDIDTQVQKTIAQGARLLTGWKRLDRSGYFYAPTVLADVTPSMTSYQEEVFGPVASIIRVKDLDEAISIANNSEFGLCGCVYGDNLEQCIEIASRIETGMVFINMPAASRASLPFWWVKKSWYGKENGPEWLKAFTNQKTIVSLKSAK